MLSRLQELRKEEETLLRLKAALHDQLNRLKVSQQPSKPRPLRVTVACIRAPGSLLRPPVLKVFRGLSPLSPPLARRLTPHLQVPSVYMHWKGLQCCKTRREFISLWGVNEVWERNLSSRVLSNFQGVVTDWKNAGLHLPCSLPRPRGNLVPMK